MNNDELNAFLEHALETGKHLVDRGLNNLAESRIDKDHVYQFLAIDSETIATCGLLLGRRDEAIAWFKRSSEYYCSMVESLRFAGKTMESEAVKCNSGLNLAIISGDNSLISRSITLSLAIRDNFPERFTDFAPTYYHLLSLVHYLQDRRETAIELLGRMSVKTNGSPSKVSMGKKACLRGLIDGDRPGLISGLNIFLAGHKQMSRGSAPQYSLISVYATVYVRVARQKGIVVDRGDIDEKLAHYIAWELLDQE